ncbi:MAG: hypothetical protein HY719_17955 [Planctomycetes bacterium]|nr:hypothetical protein [Planctomycetota bacterium]
MDFHKVKTMFIRQPAAADLVKKWYQGERGDLFYWVLKSDPRVVVHFQFAFHSPDKADRNEYVADWQATRGLRFGHVTQPDRDGGVASTPLIEFTVASGLPFAAWALAFLDAHCSGLPDDLRSFVHLALSSPSARPAAGEPEPRA